MIPDNVNRILDKKKKIKKKKLQYHFAHHERLSSFEICVCGVGKVDLLAFSLSFC
jgi:hypothetical protein